MKFEEAKDKVIGVLMGGLSKEREISLKSGKGISQALKEGGFNNVVDIDVDFDLASKLKNSEIEIAFIALHGRFGEDGAIQGLLEFMRIPYTGSGILGSALSMNKVVTKKIFSKEGIRTPEYLLFNKDSGISEVEKAINKGGFGYPLVVKPSCEGSTIGLTIVGNKSLLSAALKVGFEHDEEVVVERFIEGTEITVGILDDKPLPLVEIAPKEGVFDFKAKYTKGLTDYYAPARVSKKVSDEAMVLGEKAFRAVCCRGFGRVDMMVDKNEKPWVLEVNSIPGMTGTSLLPMAAKVLGINYADLVKKIILGSSLKIGV